MRLEEKKADMCLCLGTSLSGMNADRMASTPASKSRVDKGIIGTVLINLQQTRLDEDCSVR
jgi:NAD-dependent SIR2 family protein deacetylase